MKFALSEEKRNQDKELNNMKYLILKLFKIQLMIITRRFIKQVLQLKSSHQLVNKIEA